MPVLGGDVVRLGQEYAGAVLVHREARELRVSEVLWLRRLGIQGQRNLPVADGHLTDVEHAGHCSTETRQKAMAPWPLE